MKKVAVVCVRIVLVSVMVVPFAAIAETEKAISPVTENISASIPGETREQHDARMAWFREARFGMFIHWGVYSALGGEYKGQKGKGFGEAINIEFKIPREEYAACGKELTGAKFDADAWVKLAKDAGMKYIVFTAKHCDGFAMFRTRFSPYNIVDATPFNRDPLQELAAACRKQGMPLGFYYSHATDRLNGGYGNTWDKPERTVDEYFESVAIPQIRELMTNYGEFPSLIWWDAPGSTPPKWADAIRTMVRELKPDIVMNDRLVTEQIRKNYQNDFHVQWCGSRFVMTNDWEHHGSMNFSSWGYKKNSKNCDAGAGWVVNALVDAASKNGNLIMNITPDGEGVIPEAQIRQLTSVGQWLTVNGEAIYGTTATPFGVELGSYDPEKKGPDGKPVFKPTNEWRCTVKEDTLYIHILKWPKTATLTLPGLKTRVVKATLLAAPETSVGVEQMAAGVTLTLPEKRPDPINTVVRLELSGPVKVMQ